MRGPERRGEGGSRTEETVHLINLVVSTLNHCFPDLHAEVRYIDRIAHTGCSAQDYFTDKVQ